MMTLQKFLPSVQSTKNVPISSVLCFMGKEYPLLFFSYFIRFLTNQGTRVTVLDSLEMDVSSLKAYLETVTFDGTVTYYITNSYELPLKKRQEWHAYIQSYRGPHTIIFFSNNEKSTVHNNYYREIELPQAVAIRDFVDLRFLVHDMALNEQVSFASFFAAEHISLSLDNAFLFICYEAVLGKNVNEFFKDWMPNLIEPTQSLFLLSQHFFSKNSRKFFSLWSQAERAYQSPFWVAFWSDQLWRAYLYCDLMHKKEYAEAKKAGYKLPFSLLNRDWSSLQLDELRNALSYLADLDFKLKNGGSLIGFELFFNNFFSHVFYEKKPPKI
jgi:hypothetical protein